MSKIQFKTPEDEWAYVCQQIRSIGKFIALFEETTGESFEETYPDLSATLDKAIGTYPEGYDVNLLYYVNDNLDLITANMETPLRSHVNDWAQSSGKED